VAPLALPAPLASSGSMTFRVALTFDAEHPDRPHRAGATERVLDTLDAEGVVTTFFIQGRWAEAYPELARSIAERGHLIGNHSFYHARMPLLSDAGLAADVRAVAVLLLHPWTTATGHGLLPLIDGLRQAGATLVRLDALA